MTPERWQEVQEILDATLREPPEEHSAMLERLCGGDANLRQEAESFLAIEDRMGDFIEDPAFSLSSSGSEPPIVGRRIGAYKIERSLGHGGMGSVFLAVREDDYSQCVALKIVQQGLYSNELVRRFHNERQILAGLEHPGISRLLDGGTTDEGLPYLVMEYIEGEPIDRYCDAHHLTVRQRLELFLQVCDAVRFAHQNLVVHRDLKPGNILVTAGDTVKLLDFGIAKLQTPDAAAQFLTRQRPPMTLKYASPEQIRDEAISTASDIYSLGVLLYQLLTGRLPCDLSNCRASGIARAVCENEPERPSTVVRREEKISDSRGGLTELSLDEVSTKRRIDPRKLSRRLAGDLDAIVLTALQKDPQRRYGSVEQFSEDLRRHLSGQAVRARPATFFYRARKLVRRQKLAVAALLLLVGFTVTTTLLWGQAVRERARAENEQERAEQMKDFFLEILGVSDPEKTEAVLSATEILDRSRQLIGESFGDDPGLVADLTVQMGRIYQNLGRYDDARLLLEKSLELRAELFGEDHPQVAKSRQHLASVLRELGELEDAELLLRQALSSERRLYESDDPELLKRVNNLAVARFEMGDYQGAGELFREVLEKKRETLGEEHPDVVRTSNNLAALLELRGRYAEAEALYRHGLEMRRAAYGPRHKEVARSLHNLALVLRAQRELDEAEDLARAGLGVRRELYGDEHPDIAASQVGLGKVLAARGATEEAETLLRRALQVQQVKLGPEHPEVARTRRSLAELVTASGDLPAGESLARSALEILHRVRPEGHWHVADASSVLGENLRLQTRFQEAEPLLLEGYRSLAETRGELAIETQAARRRLVDLYEAWQRPESANRFRR